MQVACDNCDGTGVVDFIEEYIDGWPRYETGPCGVCEGGGYLYSLPPDTPTEKMGE